MDLSPAALPLTHFCNSQRNHHQAHPAIPISSLKQKSSFNKNTSQQQSPQPPSLVPLVGIGYMDYTMPQWPVTNHSYSHKALIQGLSTKEPVVRSTCNENGSRRATIDSYLKVTVLSNFSS